MKTQKTTLRGIVTSSILALTLAVGVLPAPALAFAVEAAATDATASQAASSDAGTNESANTSNAESVDADSSSNAETTTNVSNADNGESASAADTSSAAAHAEDAATATVPAATSAPSYTTTTPGHTAADVPLAGAGEAADPAAGTMEYAGITYTINPEDPTTAVASGLATDKPTGDVQIQSQVASADRLYTVVGIGNCGGGAFAPQP